MTLASYGGCHMISVQVAQLTVATTTKLQGLTAHDAIQPRHDAFLQHKKAGCLSATHPVACCNIYVPQMVALAYCYCVQGGSLEVIFTCISCYSQCMGLHTPCVVHDVLSPDVEHHFWSCLVAIAVRHEMASQLLVFGLLPARTCVPCSAVWLARPPHRRLHRLVWDMVCLAAIHAFQHSRRTAWALSSQLSVPGMIETIAVRAVKASFWAQESRSPGRLLVSLLVF